MNKNECMTEIDPQACNINAVGFALVRNNVVLMMPRPCPTAGQERAKSRGKATASADTWWTKGKAADKVWRHGQRGHMADTWQAKFGDAAKADSGRTQAGYKADMADTWPTHG